MSRGDEEVRGGRAVPAVFEPLESRVLLSAEPAGLSAEFMELESVAVDRAEAGDAHDGVVVNSTPFAVDEPFVTLDATILSEADLPTSLVSEISLPVRVTNNGNTAIPAARRWWVGAELNPEGAELYPGQSGQNAIRLVTESGVFSSALQPGQSVDVDLRFMIPLSVPAGTYTLRVLTDTNGPWPQRSDADGIVLAKQTITVTERFVTLEAAISAEAQLPSEVTAGDGTPIQLPITLTNRGNASVGIQRKANVLVYAESANGRSALLAQRDVPLDGLAPGESKAISFSMSMPRGLTADDYMLVTKIYGYFTSGMSPVTASTTQAIRVAEGFVKLDAVLSDSMKLPASVIAGDGTTFQMPVSITNNGNLAVPQGREIEVRAYAAGPNGRSELAGRVEGVSLGGLMPGQTKQVNLTAQIPRGSISGDYKLQVSVDPSREIWQSSIAGNIVWTTQSVKVTEGYVKLDTAVSTKAKLPASAISGDGSKIRLPVSITNNGNLAMEKWQTLDVVVYADRAGGGSTRVALAEDVSMRGLKPGKAKKLNLKVQLPVELTDSHYTLRVVADAAGEVPQSSTIGNTVRATQTIQITKGYVKLDTEVSAKAKLPASVLSGDGTKIRLPISMANSGNIAIEKRKKIDVVVYADRAGGDSTLVMTVEKVSVSGLKPGKAKKLNLNVRLPRGLTDGEYTLRVVADASGEVAQSTTAGNTASTTQTMNVTEGFTRLDTKFITEPTLPESVRLSDGIWVTLRASVTNSGNLPLENPGYTKLYVYADRIDGYGSELMTAAGVFRGGLKPGQTKDYKVSFRFYYYMDGGEYALRVFSEDLITGNIKGTTVRITQPITVINDLSWRPGGITITDSTIPFVFS
ncbi:MAG: CARDB domain-containing protein [Planctomycetota bacterium]